MADKFKKTWKYCGFHDGKKLWLRTHLFWLRAGDYFKIEDDDTIFMATSDPYDNPLKGPSINSVEVNDKHI
jgi:hypothetical protein